MLVSCLPTRSTIQSRFGSPALPMSMQRRRRRIFADCALLPAKVEDIFRSSLSLRERATSGAKTTRRSHLTIDPDRANMAGITNMDVANSSTAAMSGTHGERVSGRTKADPVVARLRMDDRAQLSDIQNLYVYGSQDNSKIPLVQISNVEPRTGYGPHRPDGTIPHDQCAQLSRRGPLELRSIEGGDAEAAGSARLRCHPAIRSRSAVNTTRQKQDSRIFDRDG